MEQEDSTLLYKTSCDECGSRNNLAVYSDHQHCYTPGCKNHKKLDGEASGERPLTVSDDFEPAPSKISGIPKRGLSEETCRRWNYGVGKFKGEPAQVANIYDPKTRQLIAQKFRLASKDFPIIGKTRRLPFYGQWLWSGDRRSLVITEGELDALSVSQAQDHKYPVVSLPNGVGSAVQSTIDHYEWLCEFDKIVLMFDNDEPGQKAAQEVAALLPPNKVFIADLGEFKDANEALAAGKPSAIISAYFNASEYRPEGIYTLSDIRDEVLKPVELGRPWWSETLTTWTFGRRDGEVYCFGAGTGVGKTDFFTQQIAYDVLELGIMTACIYLEQPLGETGKRIAGKVAGRCFHVPDGSWTQEELVETYAKLEATGKLLLGGNFAAAEWDQIKARVRYMAVARGVKHFYIDHLTALADPSAERESLEKIMKELALLAQELEVVIHLISHLATPDGKPHEEGGRVMLRHFKGARAIGFWTHFAFGLERNAQSDDPEERKITTFRCLKDRYTGRATGNTMPLGYDHLTGILSESQFPSEDDAGDELDV